jgi:competence protein ComEC
MTFLCVLIVAAIGIPMPERTSQLYRQALTNWDSKDYAVLLPPRVAQFRLDLQLISARLALFVGDAWAARLTLYPAVMQAGLALPMAYYFHRATTIGLPANPDRRAADSMDDACRRPRARVGIRVPVVG